MCSQLGFFIPGDLGTPGKSGKTVKSCKPFVRSKDTSGFGVRWTARPCESDFPFDNFCCGWLRPRLHKRTRLQGALDPTRALSHERNVLQHLHVGQSDNVEVPRLATATREKLSSLPRFSSETGTAREDLLSPDSPEAICGTQKILSARNADNKGKQHFSAPPRKCASRLSLCCAGEEPRTENAVPSESFLPQPAGRKKGGNAMSARKVPQKRQFQLGQRTTTLNLSRSSGPVVIGEVVH